MLTKALRPLPARSFRILKSSVKPTVNHTPICIRRKMSLFPRSIITNENPEFPPIFRLLDEFDKYSRSIDQPSRSFTRTFTPKFDVKEVADSYELHGELPGIDQKDIEIEFTDSSTLTISGHSERTSTEGHPPRVVNSKDSSGSNSNITPEENTDSSQESMKKQDDISGEQNLIEDSGEKYWVMERSIGEFSRSFTFPLQIDEDNVTATMNNGILKVIVPKVKKQVGRKIQIQ
ncbi:30 kDa heat shock protein [Erysiphe neolycopersici]|uniref:30 kDa heat shock protein n=1 Tax=Erysiphe neolycopersici TaxID=212602 RepID=A0A420HXF8_9PEZI|nr:30 kDa heat shock protein [Erysiphe neolycopersici]